MLNLVKLLSLVLILGLLDGLRLSSGSRVISIPRLCISSFKHPVSVGGESKHDEEQAVDIFQVIVYILWRS